MDGWDNRLFQRNGHIYKNRDTSAELVDWIDNNGGISGICGKKKEEIEDKLAVLMEPFMRKGKDKSHTDANEDRDDSNEVEDFMLS